MKNAQTKYPLHQWFFTKMLNANDLARFVELCTMIGEIKIARGHDEIVQVVHAKALEFQKSGLLSQEESRLVRTTIEGLERERDTLRAPIHYSPAPRQGRNIVGHRQR